jgi:maltose alpha-D-glucosyltransferase/alpha-amylase
VVKAMRKGTQVEAGGLTFRADGTKGLAALDAVDERRPLGVEQSNVCVAFGDKGMLKIYRRLRAGRQPDIEIGRFLTEKAEFPHTPAFLGEASIAREGDEPATVAACFAFVPNQGDAWGVTIDALTREIEDKVLTEAPETPVDGERGFPFPLDIAEIIGRRTGELHAALTTPTRDKAFGTERVTKADIADWARDVQAQAEDAFRRLKSAPQTDEVKELVSRRKEVEKLIRALGKTRPAGRKSRIHGDYHLGQVLVAQNDVVIIDFEGEPRRSLEERRAKSSPLRDVAGMLRSLDYAAFAALDRLRAKGAGSERADVTAAVWLDWSRESFLKAYEEAAGGIGSEELLRLFLLQKVFYEIGYEAANRPGWLSIPVRGALALIHGGK